MHIPVLLNETIKFLGPKEGETILDATIDGGGHAEAIAKKIGRHGKLIGLDEDEDVLKDTEKLFRKNNYSESIFIHGNFRELDKLLKMSGIESLDGALFDFGMSSLQLEESGRGFTFTRDEPLLMTYDPSIKEGKVTAREIINYQSERDLADLIWKYGEERYSRRIARSIVERRKKKPIVTTIDLVNIIASAVPDGYRRDRRIHFATRTFQAFRIAVNNELKSIEDGLEKAWRLLLPGGRLVAISFHSLEDRIVKNFFKNLFKSESGQILTKKPVEATGEERMLNPRSRSAKLRASKKL